MKLVTDEQDKVAPLADEIVKAQTAKTAADDKYNAIKIKLMDKTVEIASAQPSIGNNPDTAEVL